MKDKIDMGMNIPAVKGHCKIELFENGEKVKEIEQDNYVHPKYLGALNKIYSYRAFQFGRANYRGVLPDTNRIGESRAASRVPFRGLLLTDAVHAEDPEKERAVRGNIIGMGALNDNNNEQSALKGRYNISESEHTLEYHKFVYDFREEEAVGVIGSVYTTPGIVSGSSTMDMDGLTIFSQEVSGLASEYGVAYVDNDYIYYGHRGTAPHGYNAPFPAEIYRVAKSDVPNVNDAIEAESIYMPVRPVRGMTEKDGRIYMWGHVSRTTETDLEEVPAGHTFIVSAPSNDITNVRVEKLWNIDEISAMIGYNVSTSPTYQQYYARCMGDFFYDADNDQFMLMYKGVTSSHHSYAADTIYVLDSSFNLVSSSGGRNKMNQSNFYDRDTVFMADYSRDVQAENLSELSTAAAMRWQNVDTNVIYGTVRPYNEFFDIIADSRSWFSIAPAAHFFSRVLLTQPINKTSQQTMKITYEFTREPFSLDHIDDGSKYTPCAPEIIQ